jgi:hypothetical protein
MPFSPIQDMTGQIHLKSLATLIDGLCFCKRLVHEDRKKRFKHYSNAKEILKFRKK